MTKNERVQKITRLGMLAALSVALVTIVHFPLLPAASFLEYDPANIPILIAAFMYGPWYGVAITVIVSVVQGLTVSASSGIIGIIMHIGATSAFCLTAGYIYKANKTRAGALIGLIAGTLVTTLVMTGLNYLLTPLYTGSPREQVAQMLLPIIVPFNLLKAGINSALTFVVYKPVHRLFNRMSATGGDEERERV